MKKNVLFLFSVLLSTYCFGQTASLNDKQINTDLSPTSSLRLSDFILISEAENIFGKPAHIKDSLFKYSSGLLRFQFTYKANSIDSITGEMGTLFFGFEQWEQTSLAKSGYDLIKAENEKNYTVKTLDQIGDEGFVANDQSNNPFIMIRKDKKIFKLKLRNVSNKNSLDELKVLAKKIVSLY